MQPVLIDACGWVACMDARLNVEQELEALLGPCSWTVIPSMMQELERLEPQRPRSKPLLLGLLEQKATLVEAPFDGHTDNQLLSLASEEGWPVLTVDTELKRRLFEANVPVVEVKQNNRLALIEAL